MVIREQDGKWQLLAAVVRAVSTVYDYYYIFEM